MTSLTGQGFGRPVRFWEAAPLEWRGFVAADLERKPGVYSVDVIGVDASGAASNSKTTLTVVRKQFETRRLKVGGEFVNPPPAEAERIASEAKRLAEIFTRTTPRAWRGAFQAPVPVFARRLERRSWRRTQDASYLPKTSTSRATPL